MNYLGDFSEDATVYVFYTTNDSDGGRVSFSGALETADFEVIKDGNATGSVAGVTLDEDFDSRTGVHKVTIDLSDDAFYATGSDYALLLYPDETVDSQNVAAVIASWSIENRHTAAGSSPPSAAEIADAVWDEAETGHTDAGKAGAQLWTDIGAILEDTGTTLPTLITNAQSSVDGNGSALTTIGGLVVDIKAVTDLLPDAGALSDLASIDGKVDGIATQIGTAGDGLTDITLAGDLSATMKASVNAAVDDALNTAISSPTAGSIADYIMRTKYTICNKMEITESNGNTQMYNDAGAAYGSEIAAAFSSDSTTTTRKKLL